MPIVGVVEVAAVSYCLSHTALADRPRHTRNGVMRVTCCSRERGGPDQKYVCPILPINQVPT